MKKLYIIFNILIVIAFISCKHEVKNEIQADENLIEISEEQFRAENMVLGKIETREITEKIAFTGKIVPKPNGIAKISVTVPGKVLSVQVRSGLYVQANEELLIVGGVELIDLQQSFASSAAKIKQLKSNFEKAKELYHENINTENEYLLAESSYKVELANYSALKAKITNIGLNLSDIEQGKYASQYSVRTPISGQISELNIINGQHVSSETSVAEIVDKTKTELQLTLFEKDYSKVNIGQKVLFWGANRSASEVTATLSRIGGKLHSNSNAIDCFATIEGEANAYAVNQMVSGEVIVWADSVSAIPQTAVFTIGANHYILIKQSGENRQFVFEKRKISTGKSSDGYIEVLEEIADDILIRGTYNLNL